jgi:hypothetical protein
MTVVSNFENELIIPCCPLFLRRKLGQDITNRDGEIFSLGLFIDIFLQLTSAGAAPEDGVVAWIEKIEDDGALLEFTFAHHPLIAIPVGITIEGAVAVSE